jgi:peptidoglycan/LPS O-acetylase OafA/YrhL
VISQKMGRMLSAVGAVLLIVGLFLTWYHIDRTQGSTDTTGWQTFTRLRVAILLGAGLLLVSALVRQLRYVLIARTVLGLVLGLLILRRVIDPPNVSAPISTQFGVVVGLVGAIAAALGGLVDSGREVIERYPDLGFGRPPAGQLGPGRDAEAARRQGSPRSSPSPQAHRPYVDSSAEDL